MTSEENGQKTIASAKDFRKRLVRDLTLDSGLTVQVRIPTLEVLCRAGWEVVSAGSVPQGAERNPEIPDDYQAGHPADKTAMSVDEFVNWTQRLDSSSESGGDAIKFFRLIIPSILVNPKYNEDRDPDSDEVNWEDLGDIDGTDIVNKTVRLAMKSLSDRNEGVKQAARFRKEPERETPERSVSGVQDEPAGTVEDAG